MTQHINSDRHRGPRVQMEYELEIHGVTRKVELPFVTGVMADLAGKQVEPPDVNSRAFVEIDRDNFDSRMAAIQPRVAFAVPNTLTGEGELLVDITFSCIADFAPAAVARQIEPIRNLLDARPQSAGSARAHERKGEEAKHGPTETIAEIDRRIGEQLNLILHADEFQRLESTWRGLHYLVSFRSDMGVVTNNWCHFPNNSAGAIVASVAGSLFSQANLP